MYVFLQLQLMAGNSIFGKMNPNFECGEAYGVNSQISFEDVGYFDSFSPG